MEYQTIQILKDISWPTVVALGFYFVIKPLMPILVEWFRSKTNKGCSPSIHETLIKIKKT